MIIPATLRLFKPYDAKDYASEAVKILQSKSYSGSELARAKNMLKEIERSASRAKHL
jgi:hypothetical protein